MQIFSIYSKKQITVKIIQKKPPTTKIAEKDLLKIKINKRLETIVILLVSTEVHNIVFAT